MQSIIATAADVLPAERVQPWTVDTSKGSANLKLSSQWYSRPDDQRFLSLDTLRDHVAHVQQQSFSDVIEVRDVRMEAKRDDPNSLRMIVPSHKFGEVVTEPTHWSFGQVCSLLGAPAGYLRRLPASLSAINVQYALSTFREENVKTYIRQNGATELRAATGPEYGRVYDLEVVDAVRRIAGDGVGSTCWKVPGMLDWGSMRYDPLHPISNQSTTLFASDRDVFIFLVDDTHPIEIGKLANGDPDLVFRGFMVWNSEVGSKSLGISTMYLRAICCNRILWGVEGYEEITLRHSKNAPMRFDGEVRPALDSFSNASTGRLLTGIKAARAAIVARTDDERTEFLSKQGFSKPVVRQIAAAVLNEEGHPAESIWDFVQGITAAARSIGHQDERVAMEKAAGKLLKQVRV